jgi:hypothetical protein
MFDHARFELSARQIVGEEARLAFQKDFIRRLPSHTDIFSAAMENHFLAQMEDRLSALLESHSDLVRQMGLDLHDVSATET